MGVDVPDLSPPHLNPPPPWGGGTVFWLNWGTNNTDIRRGTTEVARKVPVLVPVV